jgi:vitamin B12 transport system permease protein
MTVRQLIGECFALFCAVMLGLAAGAIWLLPTLFLHRQMPWMALPVGWLLANAICQWVHKRAWNAALLASIATVVAMLYVHVLGAAMTLWEMTSGYGLIGVIRTAGISMLLDLARFGVDSRDIGWCAAGIIVAVLVSLRLSRKPQRTAI